MFEKFKTEVTPFTTKGSVWYIESIDSLQLRVNLMNPLNGSSYIDLPKCIQNKKAVINVKNIDKKCVEI